MVSHHHLPFGSPSPTSCSSSFLPSAQKVDLSGAQTQASSPSPYIHGCEPAQTGAPEPTAHRGVEEKLAAACWSPKSHRQRLRGRNQGSPIFGCLC